MPHSVIREIARGALTSKMFLLQREQRQRNSNRSDKAKQKQARLAEAGHHLMSPSGGGNGRGKPGASIMPAELVAFFARYYSAPGHVYLDPFMGQGVQMQVAKLLRMHYYGYDISEEFYRYIAAVKERIDDGTTTIDIHHGDSRHPDNIPDNIGDFSFNSPPYWDIEFYGTEAEQLGYNKSYDEFLDGMFQVARAWLPKFKSGAWHVVNVNDFRKGGMFIPYHAHTIDLFTRAGWSIHDTWIIDGLVGGMPKAFAASFNLRRIAPKVHEYVIVFRKP